MSDKDEDPGDFADDMAEQINEALTEIQKRGTRRDRDGKPRVVDTFLTYVAKILFWFLVACACIAVVGSNG